MTKAELLEQIIGDWVREGKYSTREELLRDALQALDEKEVLEKIKEGLADVKAGRVLPLEEAFIRIRERALSRRDES